MHRWPVALVLLAAVSVSAAPTGAQEQLFGEANQAYLDGDFAAALEGYTDVLNTGFQSAALHYNLGNTYFKLGQLGRAVLSYERSLRMNPGDNDARANLELTRSLIADDVTPLPRFWLLRVWDWWVSFISRGWLNVAVASTYTLSAIFLTAAILSRSKLTRTWTRRGALASAVLLAILAGNVLIHRLQLGVPTEAVILSDEVLVQSAPSDDRQLQVFTIHSGTKVRVDQQSGDWAEIVLEDGKVGWVKRGVFEII